MNSNKDWTKFWKFVAAIALALSAFAVTLSGIETFTPSEEATPRSTYQCAVYTEQGCAKFVVADGGEIEVQSGGTFDIQSGATAGFGGNLLITGTLDVDGATTLNSTLEVDGSVTALTVVDIGTLLNLTPGTTEVVSAGSVIVPVASMQPITSAAAVTCSTTACITTTGFTVGDVLILRNDNASDNITIDGVGGTVECKANVVLGAADTLMLLFDGTHWNCVSNYDNS